MMIFSVIGLLAAAAGLSPSPVASNRALAPALPAARVWSGDSILTFHRSGGRLQATVDRRWLEADFVVRARVLAVAPTAPTAAEAYPAALPHVGAYRTSGALRLRAQRDSLILLDYIGTKHGQMQYRRRAAMAILRTTAAGALIVDAERIWALIAPVGVQDLAAWPVHPGWAISLTRTPPVRVPQPSAGGPASSDISVAAVVQRLGGYTVSFGLNARRLPAVPMQPRLYDYRVRFNTVDAPGEVSPKGDSTTVRYIIRRRLEKKDPTAAVSDVVQPVIYRITGVPDGWVPAVRRAIEAWIPVFEAAGFRNAIVIRMPDDPPPAADETENTISFFEGDGAGGSTNPDNLDPRTGELVQTSIGLSTGMATFLERGYFALAGLTDTRARYPYPDSLAGILTSGAVLHELGHAFGLDHNFKATAIYPPDSMRQPTFLKRMTPMASAMGYTPINYVPQPEDHVAPADFLPRIGPADLWAIAWGYRPVPGATSPTAELPTLEQWRSVQDTAFYLQPSLVEGEGSSADPYDQPEVLSNDLLKAVQYGIRNISRLSEIMTKQPMNNAEDMSTGRYGMLDRWGILLKSLTGVIGASVPQMPYPSRIADIKWQPVDPAYQMQAVHYLLGELVYGDSASALIKQVVGAPASSSASKLVLFDAVVSPDWDPALGQRVQRAVVGMTLDVDALNRMAGQMSPAQRQQKIPPFCRELTTLGQRLAEEAKSSVPERHDEAQALYDMVAAVIAPSSGFCK